MTRFALLACALVCGCSARGETVPVAFRVIAPVRGQDGALDDRPLAGANHLVTWVEHADGERVDGSARDVQLPAARLALPTLPFASDLVLRVDAYADGIVLARGRSLPFAVTRRGAEHAPDLFIGSLGLFGRRTSATLPADVVAILPTSEGALLALDSGAVMRFSPFAATPLIATSITLDASTRLTPVGPRFLAAFSAETKALSLIAPDGAIARVLEGAPLARHGAGVMLVADPTGRTLLLVGGLDDAAAESPTAVTRVDIPENFAAATITSIASLPASRWGGTLLFIEGAAPDGARALVLGGSSHTSSTDAFLVDPRGAGVVAAVPAPDVTGASVIALAAGQALSVSGSDVRLFVIDDEPPSITIASPSPPQLSVARSSPRLVRFAPSLVLVLGGVSGGQLVRSAEIIDLRVFPGDTVQTGTLPIAVLAPHAATLGDRSVWVFDRGGIFGYVPPRGQ